MRKRLYTEDRGFQVPMVLENRLVTSSGRDASGPDPRISHRIQVGMFRSIRVDHTNCLQVVIKTHSFMRERYEGSRRQVEVPPLELSSSNPHYRDVYKNQTNRDLKVNQTDGVKKTELTRFLGQFSDQSTNLTV